MEKKLNEAQYTFDGEKKEIRAQMESIKKRERVLDSGICKIKYMHESMESEVTCLYRNTYFRFCMKIFDNPVMLTKCGHVFCRKCVELMTNGCKECADIPLLNRKTNAYVGNIDTVFSERINGLTGKIEHMKGMISDILKEA